MSVLTGTVVFANVLQRDVYKGKPTKYNLTLTLDPADATMLADAGVRIADYKDAKQRKFASDYIPSLYNADGSEFIGDVNRGSVVKIQYKLGEHNDEWGVTTYLEKVKVLVVGEGDTDEDF